MYFDSIEWLMGVAMVGIDSGLSGNLEVGELYRHTWAPFSACGPLVDSCAPGDH